MLSVVYVRELPDEMLDVKGVIVPRSEVADDILEVGGAVEKPGAAHAPSNYGIHGRYLFMPEVFEHLERVRARPTRERYNSPMPLAVLGELGRCRAYVADVELLDVGNPLGYLHANTVLGALDPVYGEDYRAIINDFLVE